MWVNLKNNRLLLKAREYIIRGTVVELKDAEVRAGDCFFIIIIIISLVVLCNSLNQEHIYFDKNSNFKNSLPPLGGGQLWAKNMDFEDHLFIVFHL